MTFDELKAMVKRDLAVDTSNLDAAASSIPTLHGKYLGFLYDESLKLKRLQSELKPLRKKRLMYYMGKADPSEYEEKPFGLKLIKSEAEKWVDSDDDVRALEDRIDTTTLRVKYLEGIVKAVMDKQWSIRNTIEFLKFKNGLV